jgi:hypothetical protein
LSLKLTNIADIIAIAQHSLKATVEAADTAMIQAIESPIYKWPRKTIRQKGGVVGSPRDIVDTGSLRDNQYCLPISQDSWEIGWTDDYAAEVHEGIDNKPARPWTEQAIKGDGNAPIRYQQPNAILDVPAFFADDFKRRI